MNEYEVITNIIERRRSVFPASYLPKDIEETTIAKVLAAANYAPTHKLTQPWRFVVITGEAKAKLGAELGRIYRETVPEAKFLQKKHDSFAEKTAQAACILAINIQFHPDQLPAWEEIASTACAVQNIALTAESLGIGAYWSSPPLIDHLDQFLGLSADEKCYGLFYMGYHEEAPRKANRTPMEEKIKWMK
ncbi:MAG: nitroreductase [Pedobacter sp.]|nr:nitroreductase [Pedobacter sp.]MDQ8053665.1 nitroreductase [Pedobacter sp.]